MKVSQCMQITWLRITYANTCVENKESVSDTKSVSISFVSNSMFNIV